jgi:hypothetical protein
MDIKSVKRSFVEETTLGIYVWEIDGKWVGDDEGNFLSITSKKGNRQRIELLRKAVSHYGVNRGEPLFLAGRRKIDDEEFNHQKQRLDWGLTPDPLDIGEYKDQMRALKKGGPATR